MLNPQQGFVCCDVLDYVLLPLVKPPQLVVNGTGTVHQQTYALPLSLCDQWIRLEDRLAQQSCVVLRHDNPLLVGGCEHNCSVLSSCTGRWCDGPALPSPVRFHCAGQFGRVTVVCGGYSHTSGNVSDTLLLMSGEDSHWQRGSDMLTGRSFAGGAVVRANDANAHRLIVAGGLDNAVLDTSELYDAVADRWVQLEARLCEQMSCHAAPIADGHVLAVQSSARRSTRCSLIDIRASHSFWSRVESPPFARDYHAVVAVDEQTIAMVGGWVGSTTTSTVQLYDARANRWTVRDEWQLPVGAVDHCAVVVGR